VTSIVNFSVVFFCDEISPPFSLPPPKQTSIFDKESRWDKQYTPFSAVLVPFSEHLTQPTRLANSPTVSLHTRGKSSRLTPSPSPQDSDFLDTKEDASCYLSLIALLPARRI